MNEGALMRNRARATAIIGPMLAPVLALALAGCVSFGEDPPDQLLTLTPTSIAAEGSAVEGNAESALAVEEPAAAQKLAVPRVPVQISASGVAYLQDATWVERPARLFQSLLAETVRSRTNRLVVDQGDLQYAAATKLSGQLLEMGYDVSRGGVIVRYDAMLVQPDGTVRTQRFENFIGGIPADVEAVGPALNEAANAVAFQVADWVGAA